MSWINGIRGLVSSEELAKDVTGAEALLERHQVLNSSFVFWYKNTDVSPSNSAHTSSFLLYIFLGTPHRDRCSCWYLPGLRTVRSAAAGTRPLRQSWDSAETRGSRLWACWPGEGLGAASHDVGPVSRAPSNSKCWAMRLCYVAAHNYLCLSSDWQLCRSLHSSSTGTVNRLRTGWQLVKPSWPVMTKVTPWTVWKPSSRNMKTLTRPLMCRSVSRFTTEWKLLIWWVIL